MPSTRKMIMQCATAELAFELVRSARRKKSMAIKIMDGQVRVTVPVAVSDKAAREFVEKKAKWIRKAQRLHAARPPIVPKEYVDGEHFSYLGEAHRLRLIQGSGAVPLVRDQSELVLGVPRHWSEARAKPFVRGQLLDWFWRQAEQHLRARTAYYAQQLGVRPKAVSVRRYKARWGSCSADGDIRYNWRIIVAPHRMVDYVVVHELCHMLHHNHSPAFWRCVAGLFPDYKECREWYKENGGQLTV